MIRMKEQLPPVCLVKTWLDLLQNKDIDETIKHKRLKLIEYYFSSVELADFYVDKNQYNHKKVS
jgi:hypothetical protein